MKKQWVPALAAVVASGCAGPTASLPPSPTTGSVMATSLHLVSEFSMPVASLVHVSVGDRYVTWSTGQTIEAYDLESKRSVTVATAVPPEILDYPQTSHGIVAYVSIAHLPQADQDLLPWSIRAVDVTTMQSVQSIQGRAPMAGALLPQPALDWPWLVWTQQEDSAYPPSYDHPPIGDTRSLNLTTGEERTLIHDWFPARISVTSGLVVAEVGQRRSNAPPTTDVYVVPANGAAKPRPLTSSGHATLPAASDGEVAWLLHGETGYDAVLVKPLSDATAMGVKIADANEGGLAIGRGFVAWIGDDGSLWVRSTTTTSHPQMIASATQFALASGVSARGSTVAWGDQLDKQFTLHVASVKLD
jgi:hypothetical protein